MPHVPVDVHRIIQHYANITDVRLGTQIFSIDMYNNWPWVTGGCGGDCYDFCLAAVESELVQCHPLHVIDTTGEAVGSPLRLVTWYLNIQLDVLSEHNMDTVFDKYTAEIVAVLY